MHLVGSPVFGIVPQTSLEPLDVSRRDPSGTMSVSYTFLRHPAERDHPENLVELTLEQAEAIAAARRSGLPEDVRARIERLRYPAIWDAVRTATTAASPSHLTPAATLRSRLEDHVREFTRRAPAPSAPRSASSTTVIVDAQSVSALELQHPDLHAVAFEVGGSTVTAVIERRFAEHLRLHFARHPDGESDIERTGR